MHKIWQREWRIKQSTSLENAAKARALNLGRVSDCCENILTFQAILICNFFYIHSTGQGAKNYLDRYSCSFYHRLAMSNLWIYDYSIVGHFLSLCFIALLHI